MGCSFVEPPTGGEGRGDPGGGGPFNGGAGGDNLPGYEDPKCPQNRYNPDYDPEICKACREECDIAHPITPCKGSMLCAMRLIEMNGARGMIVMKRLAEIGVTFAYKHEIVHHGVICAVMRRIPFSVTKRSPFHDA